MIHHLHACHCGLEQLDRQRIRSHVSQVVDSPCQGWLLMFLPEPGNVGLVAHVSFDGSFAGLASDPLSVEFPLIRSILATIDMVWCGKIFSLAVSAVAAELVVPARYGTLGPVLNSIGQN